MENHPESFVWSQISQIRIGGPAVIFRKLRTIQEIVLALLIVVAVRALGPLVLIRFGIVASHQIGGLAPMPEIYLSDRDAGRCGPKGIDIFCHDVRGVANVQLDKMWRRAVIVFPHAAVARRFIRWMPKRHRIPWADEESVDFNCSLKGTQPHISFTDEEEQLGQAGLRALGIPEGAPFVCLHGRDPAHVASVKPESDRPGSAYRNCSIHNYLPAAEEMARRGYFVLRMGSVVEEPLHTTNEMVIDYATHGRTDFLDIYLSAKCHFFLGSSSGFFHVPQIFRRPYIQTNYVPLEYAADWGPDCLLLPKKFWLREEKRFQTLRESLDTGVWLLRESEEYEEFGIDLIENTPEEITAVAIEMDERLKGTWQITEEDEELQRRFWEVFKFSDVDQSLASRMGTAFLRENRELVD